MSIWTFTNLVRRHLMFFVGYCLTWPVSTIRPPTRREFGNRRPFTTNYTSALHSQSVQSSIGIARIGTFVAVVIETPEHRAVSGSSEVMTKLIANSCIAVAGPKRSQQFIGVESNPSRHRDVRQQSRSFAPRNPKLTRSHNSIRFSEIVSDVSSTLHRLGSW